MALALLGATSLTTLPASPLTTTTHTLSSSSSFSSAIKRIYNKQRKNQVLLKGREFTRTASLSVKAVSIQDTFIRLEETGEGGDPQTAAGTTSVPKGLRRYETMAVLRSDITEAQRLELSQRYEEAIIAGGGMDVEIFNRGIMPLAYTIKTKNMGGVGTKYLDGIYFLFTYVTKPESQLALQQKFNADDDIIRSSTFTVKKEKVAK